LIGLILSAIASASATLRLCFVFTLRLLPFEVNPPVIVRDATAGELVVVLVKLGR